MGRPLKIAKTGKDTGFGWSDTYNIGVVGGDTAVDGPQVKVRVKVGSNAEADGYIIRQKGSKKFLVTDGSNEGVCVLSDLADAALTADTMTITITNADSTEVRLARISNKWGIDFSDNRFALSFTDVANDTVIKSGTAQETVDVAQVDNDSTYPGV